MEAEQRKRRRVPGEGGAYAALIMSDMPIIVGRVVDISLGGIGVQYLSSEAIISKGPIDIEIFSLNSPHRDRLRSTVIHDLEMSNEFETICSIRRCGVKFDQPIIPERLQWFAFDQKPLSLAESERNDQG